MSWILLLLVAPVCVMVLVAAICRLDLMKWRGSKAGWFLFYVGAAYLAGDVLLATVVRPDGMEVRDVVGVLMLGAYVAMTRDRWRHSAAWFTRRD